MSSPLIVPLALFAALIFVLTIHKAARIRDIAAESGGECTRKKRNMGAR
jgi:hypothetical protein